MAGQRAELEKRAREVERIADDAKELRGDLARARNRRSFLAYWVVLPEILVVLVSAISYLAISRVGSLKDNALDLSIVLFAVANILLVFLSARRGQTLEQVSDWNLFRILHKLRAAIALILIAVIVGFIQNEVRDWSADLFSDPAKREQRD